MCSALDYYYYYLIWCKRYEESMIFSRTIKSCAWMYFYKDNAPAIAAHYFHCTLPTDHTPLVRSIRTGAQGRRTVGSSRTCAHLSISFRPRYDRADGTQLAINSRGVHRLSPEEARWRREPAGDATGKRIGASIEISSIS